MDENGLIERARDGDVGAMRELYGLHASGVYAVVRRLAGDDAQADDWAQDTWIRAFRALDRFRGDARFSTWIHRIAVNSALHGRRQSQRRQRLEVAAPPAPTRALPQGERTVLRVRLERALDRLPEGMRRVIVLHDVQGYTHEEIGDLLGIAAGTSKSQLFKARARMRELLAPAEPVSEGEEACRT